MKIEFFDNFGNKYEAKDIQLCRFAWVFHKEAPSLDLFDLVFSAIHEKEIIFVSLPAAILGTKEGREWRESLIAKRDLKQIKVLAKARTTLKKRKKQIKERAAKALFASKEAKFQIW